MSAGATSSEGSAGAGGAASRLFPRGPPASGPPPPPAAGVLVSHVLAVIFLIACLTGAQRFCVPSAFLNPSWKEGDVISMLNRLLK